jgi:hypothetical protein
VQTESGHFLAVFQLAWVLGGSILIRLHLLTAGMKLSHLCGTQNGLSKTPRLQTHRQQKGNATRYSRAKYGGLRTYKMMVLACDNQCE